MLSKVRKSNEHLIYETLQSRKTLTKEEQLKLRNLELGYQGEVKFAKLLSKYVFKNYIVFFDILFENQGSITQIDCYIIRPNEVIIVEVKNFYGEFTLNDSVFTSLTSTKSYQNPLFQLHRAKNNLHAILHKVKVNLPIKSYVVFVNDRFTLFSDKHDQIILPTQLIDFLQSLNTGNGLLSKQHYKLAQYFSSLHMNTNPLEKLPIYHYHQLQRGIYCYKCSQPVKRHSSKFVCPYCYTTESLKSAVLRSTVEFNTLFPDQSITTTNIHQWIDELVSLSTVRRILQCYLKRKNKTKNVKYLF